MVVSAKEALARGWITRVKLEQMKKELLEDAAVGWEADVPSDKTPGVTAGEPYSKQKFVPPAYTASMSDEEFMVVVVIEGNHRSVT
jgi:hypothetical protein